jgi:hypothetical protein
MGARDSMSPKETGRRRRRPSTPSCSRRLAAHRLAEARRFDSGPSWWRSLFDDED